MVALADLKYSRQYNRDRYGIDRAEQIGATYVPSANAALTELHRLSGVVPGVRTPLGGSRTDAEGRRANPYLDPWASDHNFRKARALDVDNRGEIITGIARKQGVTFARATQLYFNTWARFGWRNIQIDGAPFGAEPWHMANHSSRPQGSPGVPIVGQPRPTPKPDLIENEDLMTDAMYQFAKNALGNPIDADNAIRTPAVSATLPGTAGAHIVKPLAVYYQTEPGAPLFLQQVGSEFVKGGTTDYKTPVGSAVERSAFIQSGGKVIACTGAQLASLIGLRGIVTSG